MNAKTTRGSPAGEQDPSRRRAASRGGASPNGARSTRDQQSRSFYELDKIGKAPLTLHLLKRRIITAELTSGGIVSARPRRWLRGSSTSGSAWRTPTPNV